MSESGSTEKTFRVGDFVTVPWSHPIVGEIVEDRGPIGGNRRRLYTVQVQLDPGKPFFLEANADELKPAEPEDRTIDKSEILQFLKVGGLIAILMADGVRGQRVWLRTDSLGNVIHTFAPERGFLGGEVIPRRCLDGEPPKLFLPKVDETETFLQSFGLSRDEALDVIRAVGTAP